MALNHIVLWNLKDDINKEDKEIIINNIKDNLLSLKNCRKEIIDIQFISHPLKSSTCDFSLFVKVKDEEDLKSYSESKEHLYVANTYIKPYVKNRCALDYVD